MYLYQQFNELRRSLPLISIMLSLYKHPETDMKKIFAIILISFVAITAKAQYDTHFELGLSGGISNVIAKGDYDTALAKQLADEMERMTDFELSFAYYFKTQNSLGLELFMGIASGRSSIAGSTGYLLNGNLRQGALGLTLNYRWIVDKHIVVLGAGAAELAITQSLSYTGRRFTLEAKGLGIPLKFKYEYRLNKTIALGVSAAAYLGSSNKITETDNGIQTTSEGYTSLARWAITIGPRIHF